jgi:hypothetical protein
MEGGLRDVPLGTSCPGHAGALTTSDEGAVDDPLDRPTRTRVTFAVTWPVNVTRMARG